MRWWDNDNKGWMRHQWDKLASPRKPQYTPPKLNVFKYATLIINFWCIVGTWMYFTSKIYVPSHSFCQVASLGSSQSTHVLRTRRNKSLHSPQVFAQARQRASQKVLLKTLCLGSLVLWLKWCGSGGWHSWRISLKPTMLFMNARLCSPGSDCWIN